MKIKEYAKQNTEFCHKLIDGKARWWKDDDLGKFGQNKV